MLCALAVIAGCASQSPPVHSTPAVAAAPAAVAASTVQASASAATPAQPPPGWKSKKRRSGELVYCRTVNSTGSMFPQEVCLTPEELDAALAAQKNNAQRTLDIPRTVPSQP
jgi:hypothetical protein